MPTIDVAVLEQLASRICHDLISPVGAINNGVELLEELGGGGNDEAMRLIGFSAGQASAKLQAFRLAYGAGGRDPNIKAEDVQRAFGKMIAGDGKIRQAWDPFGPLGAPDPVPNGFCKMLMLGLMLAAEALPRGGVVGVEPGATGETLIKAEGHDATVREGIEEALSGSMQDRDDLDPRMVHPTMAGLLAQKYGFDLSVKEKAEGKVIYRLAVKSSF